MSSNSSSSIFKVPDIDMVKGKRKVEENAENESIGNPSGNKRFRFSCYTPDEEIYKILKGKIKLPFDLNVVYECEMDKQDEVIVKCLDKEKHESEKEARRIRRILANRESARQTIRRRQALYEELNDKVADLTFENKDLKKSKAIALEEFMSLQMVNQKLKQQVNVSQQMCENMMHQNYGYNVRANWGDFGQSCSSNRSNTRSTNYWPYYINNSHSNSYSSHQYHHPPRMHFFPNTITTQQQQQQQCMAQTQFYNNPYLPYLQQQNYPNLNNVGCFWTFPYPSKDPTYPSNVNTNNHLYRPNLVNIDSQCPSFNVNEAYFRNYSQHNIQTKDNNRRIAPVKFQSGVVEGTRERCSKPIINSGITKLGPSEDPDSYISAYDFITGALARRRRKDLIRLKTSHNNNQTHGIFGEDQKI